MTLLEVIVALAVAGAALAAGAAVLGFLTDQQERSGALPVASANAVRSTLRDWLAGAQLTTQGDAEFRGASSSRMMNTATDELTFVTSSPTPLGETGTIVHLHMTPKGLVADLTPWRGGGRPSTVALAPDATGLRIRYLGSIYGDRRWERTWATTSVLPVAAEITMQFDGASGDRAAHALLGVPITVEFGNRR